MRIHRSKKAHHILIIEINLARLLLLAIAALLILIIFLSARSCSRRHHSEEFLVEDDAIEVLDSLPPGRAIPYYTTKMSYSRTFSDLNDLHLEAAKEIGLKEIPESREALDANHEGLVELTSTKWLNIRPMYYSSPYLVTSAAEELVNIGKAFREKLSANDLPQYRIDVTSVLRTMDDVRKLCRSGNVNATQDSAHSYGTTFDISYVKYEKVQPGGDYMNPYDLTKVLAEVLKAERDAGRIYVKYEVKQHCFHITCRI